MPKKKKKSLLQVPDSVTPAVNLIYHYPSISDTGAAFVWKLMALYFLSPLII